MPLDPAFKKGVAQAGTIPILLFPDNPVEAVYDQSPAISNVPQDGLIDAAFNVGIDAVNSSVAAQRKQAAYQTALPAIEQLSSFDLTSDMSRALASEMKKVPWLTLTPPVAISQKTFHDKETQTSKTFPNYPAFLSSLMPADRTGNFYLTLVFRQTVEANYALSLQYRLYSKDDGALIFGNQATFICPGGAANEDWANWWAANRGQWIRAAYTKGVHAAAELVAMDLGARAALDDKINVTRADNGVLTARCPDQWWK
jgi:hypothetical protein